MGFFADMKAIKDVARIKSGGTAKLSLSQITSIITNMPDARRNLSEDDFRAVYSLFKEFRKCNTRTMMNMNDYLNAMGKIIEKFDAIAPYEKYSGGNELEFSLAIEDIRADSAEHNPFVKHTTKEIVFSNDDKKYMTQIIEKSFGLINQDDAREFMKVLYHYRDYGKDEALKKFDSFTEKLIREGNGIDEIGKISFMAGLLYPNGVMTNEEIDAYNGKVIEAVMKKMNQ